MQSNWYCKLLLKTVSTVLEHCQSVACSTKKGFNIGKAFMVRSRSHRCASDKFLVVKSARDVLSSKSPKERYVSFLVRWPSFFTILTVVIFSSGILFSNGVLLVANTVSHEKYLLLKSYLYVVDYTKLQLGIAETPSLQLSFRICRN